MYDICMLVYASFNSEKYVEQDNNSPFLCKFANEIEMKQ